MQRQKMSQRKNFSNQASVLFYDICRFLPPFIGSLGHLFRHFRVVFSNRYSKAGKPSCEHRFRWISFVQNSLTLFVVWPKGSVGIKDRNKKETGSANCIRHYLNTKQIFLDTFGRSLVERCQFGAIRVQYFKILTSPSWFRWTLPVPIKIEHRIVLLEGNITPIRAFTSKTRFSSQQESHKPQIKRACRTVPIPNRKIPRPEPQVHLNTMSSRFNLWTSTKEVFRRTCSKNFVPFDRLGAVHQRNILQRTIIESNFHRIFFEEWSLFLEGYYSKNVLWIRFFRSHRSPDRFIADPLAHDASKQKNIAKNFAAQTNSGEKNLISPVVPLDCMLLRAMAKVCNIDMPKSNLPANKKKEAKKGS